MHRYHEGDIPSWFHLVNLLFLTAMLTTILPTLAALAGLVTFFAVRLPRSISRLAMHRRPKLRELRDALETAASGFYLMGYRVTLQVLLSMFYLTLTTAVGVALYMDSGEVGVI